MNKKSKDLFVRPASNNEARLYKEIIKYKRKLKEIKKILEV